MIDRDQISVELQKSGWAAGFTLFSLTASLFALVLFLPGQSYAALVSSVLPTSRSAQVGTTVTAFATMINTGPGTASGCSISPVTAVSANFLYQTTNPATNALTGTPNTPVDIAEGAAQSFVFAFTPSAPFAPTDVQLSFGCTNATPAATVSGLNSLLLSASSTPVPDIIALVTGTGIADMPASTGGIAAFAVATVNVGATGMITVSADTGSSALPVSIGVCETNPVSGVCINPTVPANTAMTTIADGETPTFAFFLTASGNIPLDPAKNRAFVRFTDSGGTVRGSTSTALRSDVPSVITPMSLVSVDSSGIQGDLGSSSPAVSSDGRYVVFASDARNLVAGDTNNKSDLFLHDTQTGTTTRVSVDSSGVQGNEGVFGGAVNANGRYIVFDSYATNLVAGDTNNAKDVFLHDTQTGATTRVSADSSGAQGNAQSRRPAISADGRYIVFESDATNLVAGDTNFDTDIFLHDTRSGTTARVSVDSSGAQTFSDDSFTPAISADGRYVAFESLAYDLVAGDTNGFIDIFVHDTQTGTTTRVSVNSSGDETDASSGTPAISADGRYIAFESSATNLVAGDTNDKLDLFLHDTLTGTTTRVSVDSRGIQGNGHTLSVPAISGDGRYIAFHSFATNLVAGGDANGERSRDVYLHDTQTGTTVRVSEDASGVQGNLESAQPAISTDGNYVVFSSYASNLVSGDSNGTIPDILRAPNPLK